MGYRSNIVIAIHKNIIAEDLISQIIPAALKREKYTDTPLARYWRLEDWKWYSDIEEVKEIETLFTVLENIPNLLHKIDGPELEQHASIAVFGASLESTGTCSINLLRKFHVRGQA